MSTFICLLIFLLSGQISSKIYSDQTLEPILKISVLYLFFVTLTGLGNGIIQGFQKFKAYARASVITSFLTPPIVLLFAWKWRVRGAILAWAVIFFVNSILLSFAVQRIRKKEGISLNLGKLLPEVHQILNFALPIFLMGIVVVPANWLAYTYLAHTFGFDQVGIFNVANAISRVVVFLPMIILIPVLPIYSEIQASGDHQRFSRVLGKNLKVIWLFTLPLVVLVCCLSKVIIRVLYGTQYSEAFTPASLMLFTGLLIVINNAVGTGIISHSKRVWHGFGLNSFWFLVFVISSYFLIPLKGALGVSLAFIFSYAVFSFVIWRYSVSVMKTQYPRLSGLVMLTVVSAGVSLSIPHLFDGGWIWLMAATYTALLTAVEWRFFLSRDEKNLLLEKFKQYKVKLVIRDRGGNAMP
ncbi:oligosaccharide flippase family protein [Candidatus Pacearchaeota archaeon]|nr:oligosaccharide flippase family protein [Candidatus Pacearchaeota archaeon]